jgi:hypothetical protein
MSRLEAPIETPYLPFTCVYARALVLHMDVDIAVRSMVRVADAPGSSETFLNPLRFRGGSPALVGYLWPAHNIARTHDYPLCTNRDELMRNGMRRAARRVGTSHVSQVSCMAA